MNAASAPGVKPALALQRERAAEAGAASADAADLLRLRALPAHARGQRIGLLGGSFNPPHLAHRQMSLFAMKRLGLDLVWWLVTPGNPLKTRSRPPPLGERVAAARRLARHPRIAVTAAEAAFGTCYTVDTVRELLRRCPGVRFVWLMGADNLFEFHRWKDWKHIAALVPIAVIDRAGWLRAAAGPAAHALAAARRKQEIGRALARTAPPAWVILFGMKSPLSSTALRREKEGGG